MNILVRSFPVLLLSVVSALNAFAAGKPAPHYLFTDDDIAGKRTNTTTIYTIQSNGNLKEKTDIVGGSDGIAGGYFGLNKAVVLKTATEKCLFFTSSASGQIAGMVIPSLKIAGIFNGADGDTGAAFGIGLTINASYVYASFTDANNIGTFQLQSGCKLQFANGLTGFVAVEVGFTHQQMKLGGVLSFFHQRAERSLLQIFSLGFARRDAEHIKIVQLASLDIPERLEDGRGIRVTLSEEVAKPQQITGLGRAWGVAHDRLEWRNS